MPLIPKHKLVFQHIPKTGGSSICKAFGVHTDGHLHLGHYQDEIIENYPNSPPAEWKTFCVVRNPITRFISAWRMFKYRADATPAPLTDKYPKLFALDDINDFLIMLFESDRRDEFLMDKAAAHFWSLASFICSAKGGVGVMEYTNQEIRDLGLIDINYPSFVLRYERLQEDMDLLTKKLDIEKINLERVNQSTDKQMIFLTNQSEEIIENLFANDYDICNNLIKHRCITNHFYKPGSLFS
tara:strand:+ start:100 stop:822 length:723 start_codon:yes stop_codon:yes gene_type:complete